MLGIPDKPIAENHIQNYEMVYLGFEVRHSRYVCIYDVSPQQMIATSYPHVPPLLETLKCDYAFVNLAYAYKSKLDLEGCLCVEEDEGFKEVWKSAQGTYTEFNEALYQYRYAKMKEFV